MLLVTPEYKFKAWIRAKILSGKFYCYYTSIVVLPVSIEVTREVVAAVEMNTSGQNNENIKIIYF